MASKVDASWVHRLAAVADDDEPSEALGPVAHHLAWLSTTERPSAELTLRVDFAAPIESDRFVSAFERVVEATPALGGGGDATAVVSVPASDWEATIAGRARAALDLVERPFASTLYVADDGACWTLRAHEAVVDATSLVRLANRTALAYANRVVPTDDAFLEFLRTEQVERWQTEEASGDLAHEPLLFYGNPARWNRLGIRRQRVRVPALDRLELDDALRVVWAATAAFVARATGRREPRIALPTDLRRRMGVGAMTEWFPLSLSIESDDTGETLLARAAKTWASTEDDRRHLRREPPAPIDVQLTVTNLDVASFDGVPARAEIGPSLLGRTWTPRVKTRDFPTLSIRLHRRDGAYELVCDLADDAFPREAPAEHLIDHLSACVDALVRTPRVAIEAIDLFPSADHGGRAAPPLSPSAGVVPTILAGAEAHPTRTAARDATTTIDYQTLVRRASRLARYLVHNGAEPETRVAMCLDRTIDLPIAMLAIHLAGAAFVPIDPHHPRSRTALVLEDAEPKIVLTLGKHVMRLRPPANARVVAIDSDREEIEAYDDSPFVASPPPNNRLAYVLYTSGSTGKPKGVQIEQGALAGFLTAMLDVVELGEGDTLLAVTTPSFDIALMELLLPLYAGGTVVIAPESVTRDPRALATWLDDGIRIMQATPATWKMLVEDGWLGAEGLVALCGGEQFPPDLAIALLSRTRRVVNLYGPTEATIWATAHEVRRRDDERVPIGHALARYEAYVVSSAGRVVPDGFEGEIYLAGVGLARGYLGRDEETKARFVPHPLDPKRRAYRTGDLGRRRADGTFECLGRLDDQVKIRGFRIELGDIESTIRRHAGIRDAAAVVREDRPGDVRIVAYVVFDGDGGPPHVQSLREHLAEALPYYMVPASIVSLPKLPLTPNGKVDRRVLRPPPATPRERPNVVLPRDDRELRIAALWRELLGVDNVGVTDRFFELGGHSLMAVSMLSNLERDFSTTLTPTAFFEEPTIEALARALDTAQPEQGASVIALEAGGDGTPLFCICGLQLYQDLARSVGRERPVYGVLAPSEVRFLADGDEALLPEVPALASQYTEAILATHPPGPIAVCGVSFGGLLAYETAQQLRAEGYQIRSVILLDTILRCATTAKRRSWLSNRIHAMLERGRAAVSAAEGDRMARARMRAYDARAERYEAMLPRYRGDVVVVRATDGDAGLDLEETLGWSEYVDGRLAVYHVPGTHLGILNGPNAVHLARCITPHIEGY